MQFMDFYTFMNNSKLVDFHALNTGTFFLPLN